MKKLGLILCICFMLTACSSNLGKSNITGLLSSPKHSHTESLIAQEISGFLGENITLKYSQTQGYDAPIQFIDIDEDKKDEALVFYYAPNKGTNIRFAMLKNAEEEWEIVFDKEGLGTEVFYFDTVKLNGLAGKQIQVGYLPTNISENFFVTYFTDTDMQTEDYTEVCEDIFVEDLTGDGFKDVVLTNVLNDGRVRLKLLIFGQDGTFKNAGTRTLGHNNIQITQMALSHTYDGAKALFVDYAEGYNRMYTEAVTLNNDILVNCLNKEFIGRNWSYEYKLNSCDIDGDGVYEIPYIIQEETAEEMPMLKFTEWADCTQPQPYIKCFGVYDTEDNIFVSLPQEWKSMVCAQYSSSIWQITEKQTQIPLVEFTKHTGQADYEDGYSHNVTIGTDVWNIRFDESVSQENMELVLNGIKIFE